MENKICFATAFYHAKGEAPNLKYSNDKFDKYYQCMIVLFASIRRFYRQEKCLIFTDRNLPLKYNEMLKYFNIETCIIKNSEIKYINVFNNNFPGCLFTLDVINYFSKNFKKNELLCLLDSDIIMQSDINSIILNNNYANSILGIEIDYSYEKKTNNYSRKDLNILSSIYSKKESIPEEFKYYGGEFYFFGRDSIDDFSKELDTLILFLNSKKELHNNDFTEEHILTILLNNNRRLVKPANDYIKRLWTSDLYHNINNNESKYSLLHMPAEKDKFFNKVFVLIKEDITFIKSMATNKYKTLIYTPIERRNNPSIKKRIVILIKKLSKLIKK